jgi:hypothetical protein
VVAGATAELGVDSAAPDLRLVVTCTLRERDRRSVPRGTGRVLHVPDSRRDALTRLAERTRATSSTARPCASGLTRSVC